ncbi:TPA: hypothetical protein JS325_001978 [Escherichia coli]|nr:hypothetical protein [Escherichia coli]
MESNIKGLVAAGHEMASELKAECGAVDMRSVAKLLREPDKLHLVCVSWKLCLMLRKLKYWSVTVPRVAPGVRLTNLVSI